MGETRTQAKYPVMYRVKQRFAEEAILDIPAAIFAELDRIGLKEKIKPGMEIGVTCGSRGINHIALIIKTACDYIRLAGGQPFILPAMGSHGGATAEGQAHVCEKFGVTEDYVGCPIRSSMDVVQLPDTPEGIPVYVSKTAMEADGVLVINRVKPHTDFTAHNESGVVKMLSVGLGKQKGASAMHDNGLGRAIPAAAKVILAHAPILAGLGVVENAKDETAIVRGILTEHFLEEDAALLKESYALVPKLPAKEMDILIVKEMGKQYSGTGMDTKVIGRMKILGEAEPESPRIKKIVTLRLSKDSYGNALGIGLADLTVKQLVDQIDYEAMYSNLITTTFLERGKVPVHLKTEEEAIAVAFRTLGNVEAAKAKVMVIENTLHIGTVLVSEALYEEIKDQVDLVEGGLEMAFDAEGRLC